MGDFEDNLPPNIFPLALKDIASWQFRKLAKPKIIAGLPSLQRGAVWEPRQIELFWDSVLRGFPVGSLVVCEKLVDQKLQSAKASKVGATDDDVNRHLLDGQQRCNAIAFGFADPFDDDSSETAILWLDLDPKKTPTSTRNFWVRLTTEAHPWGYTKDDTVSRISAEKIRKALVAYGWRTREDEDITGKSDRLERPRPLPKETWPFESEIPIPLAWLMLDVADRKDPPDETTFWDKINIRCQQRTEEWANKVRDFLSSYDAKDQKTFIFQGLERACRLQILALQVPEDAIRSRNVQEQAQHAIGGQTKEPSQDISSVEHLFQRLNRGGTVLDGEELNYSLIKAYWPDLETPVGQLSKKYMPAPRLVTLGVRAALASPTDKPEKLPATVSVSALRSIAQEQSDKRRDEQKKILTFFGKSESDELGKVCALIDYWLLHSNNLNFGLPPVLRTSIAHGSPDVYLLLMGIARRELSEYDQDLEKTKEATGLLRRRIVAMVTALHWFGIDKAKSANHLYTDRFCKNKLDESIFNGALFSCYGFGNNITGVAKIWTPKELEETLDQFIFDVDLDGSKEFEEMRWWKLNKDGEIPSLFVRMYNNICNNNELLLYAQRDFLSKRFYKYDPARQDLWKDHNRPWDFDHILARRILSNNQGKFRPVCKEWLNTIGNLRAWPFENNRSDQTNKANDKITIKEFNDSLINDSIECGDFSIEWEDVGDPHKAHKFISAARKRLIRIYKEWYDTLELQYLI